MGSLLKRRCNGVPKMVAASSRERAFIDAKDKILIQMGKRNISFPIIFTLMEESGRHLLKESLEFLHTVIPK